MRRGSRAVAETARAPITTILFTDLVDSTTLMQRVGDERAQKLFETHHQLVSALERRLVDDPGSVPTKDLSVARGSTHRLGRRTGGQHSRVTAGRGTLGLASL